jgi:membrane protease YdiL (CAAX protease family)
MPQGPLTVIEWCGAGPTKKALSISAVRREAAAKGTSAFRWCPQGSMTRPNALASFFVLSFAISWALALPALLAMHGVLSGGPSRYIALVGLGGFGPMLAAMVVARADGGLSALLRPLAIWRVDARFYLAALGLPGSIFVAAAALYNLLGHAEPYFYPPNRPAFIAALIVFSIGEEIGWRGFALPRLLNRYGPLLASAILGVLWTAWHIPMLALQGVSPVLYLAFVPYMIGGSVLFTWIYQHTRGSLWLAVLAHVGAHLNNPGHALPGRSMPIVLHSVAYVALAAVLIGVDRSVFGSRPALNASMGRQARAPG